MSNARFVGAYILGAIIGGYLGGKIAEMIIGEEELPSEPESTSSIVGLADNEPIPDDAIVVEGVLVRPDDELIVEETTEGKKKVTTKKKKGSANGVVDYTKYANIANPHVKKARLEELTAKYKQEEPESIAQDPGQPMIISFDDFVEAGNTYKKINLTYYAGDNTLADQDEKIIDDVIRRIGSKALVNFGTRSDDPTTVFVRNNRLAEDYEITRVDGSYAELVGLNEEEEEEEPPRRTRKKKGKPVDEDDKD